MNFEPQHLSTVNNNNVNALPTTKTISSIRYNGRRYVVETIYKVGEQIREQDERKVKHLQKILSIMSDEENPFPKVLINDKEEIHVIHLKKENEVIDFPCSLFSHAKQIILTPQVVKPDCLEEKKEIKKIEEFGQNLSPQVKEEVPIATPIQNSGLDENSKQFFQAEQYTHTLCFSSLFSAFFYSLVAAFIQKKNDFKGLNQNLEELKGWAEKVPLLQQEHFESNLEKGVFLIKQFQDAPNLSSLGEVGSYQAVSFTIKLLLWRSTGQSIEDLGVMETLNKIIGMNISSFSYSLEGQGDHIELVSAQQQEEKVQGVAIFFDGDNYYTLMDYRNIPFE